MATCNFWTMRDFDLWVVLEDDEIEDPDYYGFLWHEIERELDLDAVNDGLIFHQIRMKSGYYSGLQILIEEKDNPHEMGNDSTRYYFDMCRSEAVRKYDAEIRKIRRWMEKKLPAVGFVKIRCVGVFGNGEAIYEYAA